MIARNAEGCAYKCHQCLNLAAGMLNSGVWAPGPLCYVPQPAPTPPPTPPPGGNCTMVGCSGHGRCMSPTDLCECEPQYGGSACQSQLVPAIRERGYVDMWGGAVDEANAPGFSACLPTNHGTYWNLDNGPLIGQLKSYTGGCEATNVNIPPGLCVQTFALTGRWDGYGDDGTWPTTGCTAPRCTNLGKVCGGQDGANNVTFSGGHWFCAFHVTTQEGWTCDP